MFVEVSNTEWAVLYTIIDPWVQYYLCAWKILYILKFLRSTSDKNPDP